MGLSPEVGGVDQTRAVPEVPPWVSRTKRVFFGVNLVM
jgi:hypothetical protein